ncbi:hypothetical protein [Alicyclobacillus macrosporangiidus]|uniref:Cytochrome C and Quinol oxidase polypeptide I n=1 Tax=Alicyclobacillus macrosporangiidus TaxID=392015 RepID=A0A1I7F599_9BACL|nr:hypothetical protein [Alicyclobacillus macrosporangiidus]SFU31326.1 hypothetical protein SAMN05421543_10168 [Alicyclobacillus macrosporangiidus]
MERGMPAGGPGGPVTSQAPPFTVPMRYMLLGMAGFVLFAFDLVAQSIHLSGGGAFLPQVVALTHLLTLGSLLSFIMGAVYQLVTVAFLVPIASERCARWNFWLYAASAFGLIGSMAIWSLTGLLVFGSLATVSLYVYAILIIVSVSRSRIRGPMLWFVISAHVYLMAAVAAAWLMIASISGLRLGGVFPQLLATHILLALGGFFTFLVMGFSFKLLPMFTLSHGFATWRQKWTWVLAHAAVCLALIGIWAQRPALEWAGGVAGWMAFASLLFDIREIFRKRLRKKTEPPTRMVVVAAVAGMAGVLWMLVQLGSGREQDGWQGVVTFYLLGWVVLTLMGYAYKIVPFLIWTQRYSAKAGRNAGAGDRPGPGMRAHTAGSAPDAVTASPPVKPQKVPVIADLIQLGRSRPVLQSFAIGVMVLSFSGVARFTAGAVAGSIMIALSVLGFIWQLQRVVDPKQVAKELRGHD